ncbi:class I SAM-dependent methyltransferase [Alphaproteobacteria bacterium]|nr:class I SAM-dependent methyltransferase [Alphaproteobacteria bacterium]
MGISAFELQTIIWLIEQRRKTAPDGPLRVLCLSYPDMLIDRTDMSWLIGEEAADGLRIREDSAQIAKGHNLEKFSDSVVYPEDVFKALGVDFVISDVRASPTTHVVFDLNEPMPPSFVDNYDLIIDPGTIEHCFNIAQAMKNLAEMTKVGGFIFHQVPGAYINHGFYSISPTFLLDFYQKNGFLVLDLRYPIKKEDQSAQNPTDRLDFVDMMTFDAPTELTTYPIVLRAIVMKQRVAQIKWPMQRIYGGP